MAEPTNPVVAVMPVSILPLSDATTDGTVSFGETVDALMPPNVHFYRYDESVRFSMNCVGKMPLPQALSDKIESVLRLKKGTCYVISQWMRLKALEGACIEREQKCQNQIVKRKKPNEQQRAYAHVTWFFHKTVNEFETTYAEILEQPQIQGLYYLKSRMRSMAVAMRKRTNSEMTDSMASSVFSKPLMPSVCYQYVDCDSKEDSENGCVVLAAGLVKIE